MVRYVAFLRGINVGGHTVKMAPLRRHFEDLGLADVRTFIASGNVLFEAPAGGAAELEQRIEHALHLALGYAVATFLRTAAEVARIAGQAPIADLEPAPGDTAYIVFLRAAPDAATRDRIGALSNAQDVLRFDRRELYWLRRGSLLETTISSTALGQALGGAQTTMRNANTLRRLAARYPPA